MNRELEEALAKANREETLESRIASLEAQLKVAKEGLEQIDSTGCRTDSQFAYEILYKLKEMEKSK